MFAELRYYAISEGLDDYALEDMPIPTDIWSHILPTLDQPHPWNRGSAFNQDFILLAEFCELDGPKPLVIIPPNSGGDINLNDFVLKIMSVDEMYKSGFTINDDRQQIISDCNSGIHSYVHHFTLYDIHARGFVRPFCMAFITADKGKLIRCNEVVMREFNKVSEYFKISNYQLFLHDLNCYLADLVYTKEKAYEYQTAMARSASLNRNFMLKADVHEISPLMSQSISTLAETYNEVLLIYNVFVNHLLKSNILVSETLRNWITKTASEDSELCDEDTPDSYYSAQEIRSYKPRLIQIGNRKFEMYLRTINELCSSNAALALNRLNAIQKCLSNDIASLYIEEFEKAFMDPYSSLLTIGQCVQSNVAKPKLQDLHRQESVCVLCKVQNKTLDKITALQCSDESNGFQLLTWKLPGNGSGRVCNLTSKREQSQSTENLLKENNFNENRIVLSSKSRSCGSLIESHVVNSDSAALRISTDTLTNCTSKPRDNYNHLGRRSDLSSLDDPAEEPCKNRASETPVDISDEFCYKKQKISSSPESFTNPSALESSEALSNGSTPCPGYASNNTHLLQGSTLLNTCNGTFHIPLNIFEQPANPNLKSSECSASYKTAIQCDNFISSDSLAQYYDVSSESSLSCQNSSYVYGFFTDRLIDKKRPANSSGLHFNRSISIPWKDIQDLAGCLGNKNLTHKDSLYKQDYVFINPKKCLQSNSVMATRVFTSAEHISRLSQNVPGFGILNVIQEYLYIENVLVSILIGRPVVVIGNFLMCHHIKDVITALSLFLPNCSMQTSSTLNFVTKPLSLRDLTTSKLIGACRPEKRGLSFIINTSLQKYVTIIDVDKKCIRSPSYPNSFVSDILQKAKNFSSDVAFCAYIHSHMMRLSRKAFIVYNNLCFGSSKINFSDGTNIEEIRRNYKTYISDMMKSLYINCTDSRIVMYLVELIKHQRLNEDNASMEFISGLSLNTKSLQMENCLIFRC